MRRINICTIPSGYRFERRKISRKFNSKQGIIDGSIVLARFTLRKSYILILKTLTLK